MINQATTRYGEGIEIKAAVTPEFAEIVTPEALSFVATLARAIEERRQSLLQRRIERQAEIDAGKMPDFLAETEYIRKSNWTIAPLPADLQDRRVEITGPVDRKMVINALNSGAKVFMADFEDFIRQPGRLLFRGRSMCAMPSHGLLRSQVQKESATNLINNLPSFLYVHEAGIFLKNTC